MKIIVENEHIYWDNDEERWFFNNDDDFEKAQPLVEYKKQVVKEVCEEIREELEPKNANHIDELINEPTEQTILISKGFKACKERVFNKLDQIQENINKE